MLLKVPLTALALLAPAVVPLALSSSSASDHRPSTTISSERPQDSSFLERRTRTEEDSSGPATILPRRMGGRRALDVLEGRIKAVARLNGLPESGLRSILRSDTTAFVDQSGKLGYREHIDFSTKAGSVSDRTLFPHADTFRLQSRPGSTRTIYLDFNGATVSGTAWNGAQNTHIPDGYYDGFDLDGDFDNWSDEEHATVQTVWAQVSEDFAPFDVNVTTAPPLTGQIDRSGPSDQVYGTTVVISGDPVAHSALCGSEFCTGIAYVDVFDLCKTCIPDVSAPAHGFYQPAWAFTTYVNDSRTIAETASHEAGHNLGLVHDGRAPDTYYYAGHRLWAPIMGSGIRPIIQWSNAAYAGGRNLDPSDEFVIPLQDDIALIDANGAPLLPDDAADGLGSATIIRSSVTGVIGHRNDVDVYDLGTCSGFLNVSAEAAPISPNLDIELRLLDESGKTLDLANPPSGPGDGRTASGMGASLTVEPAGRRLFVRVDGVGTGNPTDDYDDYGSLGRYTLSVSGCGILTPTASPSPTGTALPTATASPTASPTTSPTATPTASPTTTTSPTATASPTVTTNPSPTTTATPDPDVSVPDAPIMGSVKPGPRGGLRTARITWFAPPDDGGSEITGYRMFAHKVVDGTIVRSLRSGELPADRFRAEFEMPKGRWSFRVAALNAEGESAPSGFSRVVKPR